MNAFIDHIRAAGREGGWALALIVAVAALTLTAIAQFNPAQEAGEGIGKPIVAALPLGLVHERCPGGWEDTTNVDVHVVNRTCEKDGVLVVLKEDGTFNYAVILGGDIIEEEGEVPGWSTD